MNTQTMTQMAVVVLIVLVTMYAVNRIDPLKSFIQA